MRVMSSGKPHQSQDLQTRSCGPGARPRPRASCLGPYTTAHVSLNTVARCGTCGGCHCRRVSADTPLTAWRRPPSAPGQAHTLTQFCTHVHGHCVWKFHCEGSLQDPAPSWTEACGVACEVGRCVVCVGGGGRLPPPESGDIKPLPLPLPVPLLLSNARAPASAVPQVAQDTEGTMSKFFMVSGILIFIALAFCFAGILQHTFFGRFVPSRPYDATFAVQLLNYTDWEAFGAHCCCLAETEDVEEKWVCDNNRSVNRLRVSDNVSGLVVRPFCSRAFEPGCSLVATNDTPTKVEVRCTFNVEELQDLW